MLNVAPARSCPVLDGSTAPPSPGHSETAPPTLITAFATCSRDGPTGSLGFPKGEGGAVPETVAAGGMRERINPHHVGRMERLWLHRRANPSVADGGLDPNMGTPTVITSVVDCTLGPNRLLFWVTHGLIIVPACIYWLALRPRAPAVVFIVFSVSFVVWALWRTAVTDPGVLHRGEPLPDELPTPKAVPVVSCGNAVIDVAVPSEMLEITARGDGGEGGGDGPQQLERRWCFSCNVLRPLRASHCNECGVCVERRDHHCPWTGTCIGRRNYPYFFVFIWSVTVLLAAGTILLMRSLAHRVGELGIAHATDNPDTPEPPPLDRLSRASRQTGHVELLLFFYCGLLLVIILPLALYHVCIASKGQTTREAVRREFVTTAADGTGTCTCNPYDAGSALGNLYEALVAPIAEEVASYRAEVWELWVPQGQKMSEATRLEVAGPVEAGAPTVVRPPPTSATVAAVVDRVLCCCDRVGAGSAYNYCDHNAPQTDAPAPPQQPTMSLYPPAAIPANMA